MIEHEMIIVVSLILSLTLGVCFIQWLPLSNCPLGNIQTIEGKLCWYMYDGINKLQDERLLSRRDKVFIHYRSVIVESLFRINFNAIPEVVSSSKDKMDNLTSGMNGEPSNRFSLTSLSIMASFLSMELTRSRHTIVLNSGSANSNALSMRLVEIRDMRTLAYKKSLLHGKMFDSAMKQVAGTLRKSVIEKTK